jgi:hypothetical protein
MLAGFILTIQIREACPPVGQETLYTHREGGYKTGEMLRGILLSA